MRLIRQMVPGLLAVLLLGSQAYAEDNAAQPAVWKEQSIEFTYFGRTSRYSCDGIRDKLRTILAIMGVRRDIHALAVGCIETGETHGLHQASPSVRLVFSSPSLPDAGAKPAHPNDLAPLDAQFQAFSIVADAFRNLEPGDCELVEEFVRQVLPKLATRNVESNVACIPYQLSGSHYLVRGEALMPVVAH